MFAADDPRLFVLAEAFINLPLPGVVLSEGENHQLVQRQAAVSIDLRQIGADSAASIYTSVCGSCARCAATS
jgi:hypothetical protein